MLLTEFSKFGEFDYHFKKSPLMKNVFDCFTEIFTDDSLPISHILLCKSLYLELCLVLSETSFNFSDLNKEQCLDCLTDQFLFNALNLSKNRFRRLFSMFSTNFKRKFSNLKMIKHSIWKSIELSMSNEVDDAPFKDFSIACLSLPITKFLPTISKFVSFVIKQMSCDLSYECKNEQMRTFSWLTLKHDNELTLQIFYCLRNCLNSKNVIYFLIK